MIRSIVSAVQVRDEFAKRGCQLNRLQTHVDDLAALFGAQARVGAGERALAQLHHKRGTREREFEQTERVAVQQADRQIVRLARRIGHQWDRSAKLLAGRGDEVVKRDRQRPFLR